MKKDYKKMEITRDLQQFYIKKSYFEIKNNVISINLNQSNNYCLYSFQKRFSLNKIVINYL